MRYQPKKFYSALVLSLLPALYAPLLFPQMRLQYLAPFLILGLYQRTLSQSLWDAACCGILLDTLNASQPAGIHFLSYTTTIYLVSRIRRHFFEDSLTTLPLLTFSFSVICTITTSLLMGAFYAMPLYLNKADWIMSDLFLMPLADALYALAWFAPLRFFVYHPKPRDSYILRSRGS